MECNDAMQIHMDSLCVCVCVGEGGGVDLLHNGHKWQHKIANSIIYGTVDDWWWRNSLLQQFGGKPSNFSLNRLTFDKQKNNEQWHNTTHDSVISQIKFVLELFQEPDGGCALVRLSYQVKVM